VLPEITYLLGQRIGAPAELMATYEDAPIGFVDASLIATAERLDITSVLTTDRRHFSFVRPRHVRAFRLLP
jgi:predicted nucleic acid-binding protein